MKDPNSTSSTIDDRFEAGQGSYSTERLASLEQNAAPSDAPESADDVYQSEQEGSSWATDVSARKDSPKKMTGKLLLRKGGPAAGILGLLGGAIGLMMVLFTPGLAALHMQEVFSSDLDDITAGLDERSLHVFKSRINGFTSGICGDKITLKCKFRSTSGRQIKALERAGIEVDCGSGFGSCDKLLRNKIKAMKFSDGSVIDKPNAVFDQLRKNPVAMKQMYRAFNLKWYSLNTPAAAKAFKMLGVDKARKLVGSDKKKISESLNKAVNGRSAPSVDGISVTEIKDDDGNVLRYEDDAGNSYTKAELDNKNGGIKAALDKVRASKGFGSAVKGASLIGAVDAACTVYQTARSVSLIAKVIRHQRLVAFALAFLSTASAIRAGEATEDEVRYLGDKLTEVDWREYVGESDDGTQKLPNPGYGESALSGPLYRLSQFGEVPNPENMSTSISSFMVGGTGAGILNQIYAGAKAAIGGSPRDTCGIVQNPLVRGASIVLGVVASATPLGIVKLVVGGVAGMVATNLAMGYLESMITEQAEDIDLDSLARYGDFSAAIFTGTSGVYGASAAASGAAPLTDATLETYLSRRSNAEERIASIERNIARETPFDINNQYSFLGTAARNLVTVASGRQSIFGKFAALAGAALPSSSGAVSAKTVDTSRFTHCEDEDYDDLGIKADVMCNVRYGWSEYELSLDSGDVIDFMVDGLYVRNEAPEEADLDKLARTDTDQGRLFTKWVTWCANRDTPFGEQGAEQDLLGGGGEDGWTTGANCLGSGGDIDKTTLAHFKIFAADYNVIQAMDYPPAPIGGQARGTSSGELVGDKAYPIAKGTNAGTYEGHHGVDFPAPQGTPIFAVADGEVTSVMKDDYGANIIFVLHEGGVLTLYAHMHDGPSGVLVKAGDSVVAGQQIGEVGTTGNSTGNHLHFEVYLDTPPGTKERWNSTTAPFRWLKMNGIAPGELRLGDGSILTNPLLEDDLNATGVYTN